AAAAAPAARTRPLRGARGTGDSHDRTACWATGCCRCRTIGAGRPARLEPGERRAGRTGHAETAGRGPARDARVPGGGRQRAATRARARGAARPPARPAGARGAAAEKGRGVGAARRRRLVAPDRHAPRADRRPGPAPGGAGSEARRAAGAGVEAAPRGVAARRAHRRAARARRCRGKRAREQAARRPAPGEGRRRRGRGLDSGGGCAVVADTGSARTARTARRLNAPRPALVESHADGIPRRVNRQTVAVVREEWRVVDRWWTEEPVSRRYFDLVLETG